MNSGRKELLTEVEVAEILTVPVATLRYWRWKKMGPDFSKLENGSVRYRAEDVDEYVRKNLRSQRAIKD